MVAAYSFTVSRSTVRIMKRLQGILGTDTNAGVLTRALALARVCGAKADTNGHLTIRKPNGQIKRIDLRN